MKSRAIGPTISAAMASGDYRLRLLATEHRLGDLLGVRHVGEAALVDGDAGDCQPLDDFLPELGSDLVEVATQGDVLVLESYG